MGTSFHKALNSLLLVHFLGSVVSFIYFSYQYVLENGFFSWVFFGEIKPALKAVVWEIFLAITLMQSPTQGSTVSSSTQELWWQGEYPALIRAVDGTANSSLSTSYRTGPGGRSTVRLLLSKTRADSLVLEMEFPREAMVSGDPNRGVKTPSETPPRITIRDHNLDGMPDDFNIEPAGQPVYKEEFTEDGFVKFRDSSEHQAILVQWSVGIGYSVNHFLHGIDSAVPRE